MSGRRTAVLGGVLLLLALYFAVFEGFRPERAAPEWERDAKMLDCRSRPPRELSVSTEKGTVSARFVHERWETEAGGLAPVAFTSLAEIVCRLPVIDRIQGELRLGEFGLDPPAAKVKVGAKEIWLGNSTPAENLMYAKLADQSEVLKIGVELKSAVGRVTLYLESGAS